ncbi:MAG: hypothetical protein R3B57_11110 [Phycisphaerales bacterium]
MRAERVMRAGASDSRRARRLATTLAVTPVYKDGREAVWEELRGELREHARRSLRPVVRARALTLMYA